MSILLKTHKMLWGRSGNKCAFPDCQKELVMDISDTDSISVVGEECHIVAREANGPRGKSDLTPEQRDMYGNLILMCRNHHKIIDDNPDKYSVEILLELKKQHESWVQQNLTFDEKKQKEDEFYATYIDEFIRLADIENWQAWTSFLLSADGPYIGTERYNNLRKLIEYVISRVWFGRYPDLENSLLNFKNVLNDLLKVFDKHRKSDGNRIWTRKFYHIDEWNPEKYERLANKYEYHVALVEDITFELTRAANYVFDKVRANLFSSYRIKEGVLLLEMGPFSGMTFRTFRSEYQNEERIEKPYPGLREFMEIRSTRDDAFGEGVSEDYFVTVRGE